MRPGSGKCLSPDHVPGSCVGDAEQNLAAALVASATQYRASRQTQSFFWLLTPNGLLREQQDSLEVLHVVMWGVPS